MIKRFVVAFALLIAASTTGRAGPVTSLNQITTWVGSGSDQAGFVVDWNNGTTTQSLVWGYRWDPTITPNPTVQDMMWALAAANVGLYFTVGYFDGLGYAMFGAGFDLNQNGIFGVTPAPNPPGFVDEIYTEQRDHQLVESRAPTDPGDYYQEGWFSAGYWAFWYTSGSSQDWGYSPLGISSLPLTNDTWIGWSFAYNFSDVKPATPLNAPNGPATSVPEPSSFILALSAGASLLIFRRWRPRIQLV